MKKIALAAVLALACLVPASTAAKTTHAASPTQRPPARCTIDGFRLFSAAVWRPGAWERGNPPRAVLRARTASYGCAAPAHRQAMKRTWRRDAAAYFAHRHYMKVKQIIEPFSGCTVGGCDTWAIPAPMVNCESGGGAMSDNIYANLTGSYYPGMSKWDQSVAAHKILVESGLYGAWLQWESGCSGWPWGLL